jgi:hypothetical protein
VSFSLAGQTSNFAYYNWSLTNPQKGIWSFTMLDMISPQKEIDLMNNTSIINRILFAVTIFQQTIHYCIIDILCLVALSLGFVRDKAIVFYF